MSFTERRRERALSRANGRRSGFLGFIWEWFRSVAIALTLFFIVRSFFVEAFKIPTGSMEGTLLVGDFLLVNKMVYGAEVPFTKVKLPAIRSPQRGDIIVFQWPLDPTKNFVKRIVGMPGDTLEMRSGNLIRNGKLQKEPYVVHTSPGSDPEDVEFKWQLGYLLGANHPVARRLEVRSQSARFRRAPVITQRGTTGARSSFQGATTSFSATTETTLSTVVTGAGWPTHLCAGNPLWSIIATTPMAPLSSIG
jgi:signal peptidase I